MIAIKTITPQLLKSFYSKISDMFSAKNHTHTTVNGHTVESDVPANANFDTILKGTLLKGETSLTLTSSSITEESLLTVYADKYGLSVSYIEVNPGSVTITFSEQSSDMDVKVVVR